MPYHSWSITPQGLLLDLWMGAITDKARANSAIIALLVQALHPPKSAFAFKSGTTSRIKTVQITGDSTQLVAKITTQTTNSP